MNLAWYAKRLARMSPTEIRGRIDDTMRKRRWRERQILVAEDDHLPVPRDAARFATGVGGLDVDLSTVSAPVRARIIACADEALEGRFHLFDRTRTELGTDPDWFLDARTGKRAPAQDYCFDINIRDVDQVGTIKYVWEPSRHYQLTVLAAAYALTQDEKYAEHVAAQLKCWWAANPFLSGVHWTSGIELGVRLISWVWVRRLLDGWDKVENLFERNPVCLRQLHHHQDYLAAFPSHGSSANNHLIAEMAGLFAAACAFPWFTQSARWRAKAAASLNAEIPRQTFRSGLNRELASDYHVFVWELNMAAAVEGEAAGHGLSTQVWDTLARSCDALAAVLDSAGRKPRQGDGDDAYGLVLDDPLYDQAGAMLASGRAVFGAGGWWPEAGEADLRTLLWRALAGEKTASEPRVASRPALLEDAGMAILRAGEGAEEIWCRCDHGPHGFLSIAAHGHADALSVELRHGGVDILADPGTYTYQGEAEWRAYFRSTIGHNTLELGGEDQSVSGGPFLWTRSAQAALTKVEGLEASGGTALWQAEHDGYMRLKPAATHRRAVRLDREARTLTIEDWVLANDQLPARLAFHLGPQVSVALEGEAAMLTWTDQHGAARTARMELPAALKWRVVTGQSEPPLGWYSPCFGAKSPISVLLGEGELGQGRSVTTRLAFGVGA